MVAAQALGAFSAVVDRVYRDLVPHAEVRAVVDLHDLPGELVAERQGQGLVRDRVRAALGRDEDRPREVLVKIRPADPTPVNLHLDGFVPQLRLRYFIHPDVLRAIEYRCLHATLLSSRALHIPMCEPFPFPGTGL